MKFFKALIMVFLIFSCLCSSKCIAFTSGFETERLSDHNIDQIASKQNFCVLDSTSFDLSNSHLECFSVNRFHEIALGFRNQRNEGYILLLNQTKPVCTFRFFCNSSFQIELGDDYINIHDVRSSVIAKYTLTGTLIDIAKVCESEDNNSYKTFLYDKMSFSFSECDYIATRTGAYISEIKIVYPNGVETVIYKDAQHDCVLLCLTIVFPICLVVIYLQYFSKKRAKETMICNKGK